MSILVKDVEMPKNCNACKFEKGCAWCGFTGRYTLGNRLKARLDDCPLVELPPAQPEQNIATWFIRKWGDDAKCSNCGHTFKDVYDMDNHDRFCRFCGRKMIGVKGELI